MNRGYKNLFSIVLGLSVMSCGVLTKELSPKAEPVVEDVPPSSKIRGPRSFDVYIPDSKDIEHAKRIEREAQEALKGKTVDAENVGIESLNPSAEEQNLQVIKGVEKPVNPELPVQPVGQAENNKKISEKIINQTSRRPLHPRLRDILESIKLNDVRAAYRVISNIDEKNLAPQDRFLLQVLQANIYFRLGDDLTALELVDDLREDLREAMPLKIKKMIIASGPLSTIRFGRYRARQDSFFRRKEKIYLYLELDNVSQEQDGDYWKTSMQVDFEIKDSTGHLVSDMKKFDKACNEHDTLKNNRNKNYRNDVYKAFIVEVPQHINPGNYSLTLKLRDLNSPERGQAESTVSFTME